MYMASSGNPTRMLEAKRALRQAIMGLVIVAGAGVLVSLLSNAMTAPSTGTSASALSLTPIQPAVQNGSLVQVLLDAVSGFLQNLVQSATKPVLDAITGFLTNTPSLASNSVVFNFWLVTLGIADSLYVLVIALLGFRVMGASSFGYGDVSLKELMPKIGLSFVLANTSIFLIDWTVELSQAMVHAVLDATGGLGNAWILNAFDPGSLTGGTTLLVTLVFMVVFVMLAVVLLLFYIARLMLLAFGAVMSPLVCLLWLVPGMEGFAVSSFKAYLVTVFTLFAHVVIIQLASAFLTVPGQAGSNPLISVLIGIAMFTILLKGTASATQLMLASQTANVFKKVGGQFMNAASGTSAVAAAGRGTR